MGGRVCIFCGATANSGEHLLPEWLQGLIASDDPHVLWREVGGEKTTWEKRGFTEKTKVVCGGCNNGWMSRLEEAAKDVLSPAITRSVLPYSLDLRSQWIAAQWAMKTCYVFQGQAPEPIAPMNRPPLLRMNGKPPPQASIFVGTNYRALKDPMNARYMQKAISLRLTPEDQHLKSTSDFGYVSYLAIGGLVFLILEHRYGNHVEITLGEHTSDMFLKIWPWTRKVVLWPPEVFTDSELIEPFFLNSEPPGFEIEIFPV